MNMASSSFESLVQPKLANSLPIPNPPFCSELGNLESLLNGLSGVDSVWQNRQLPSTAELVAESERMGKLLENADVSYMSIRDEVRSAKPIGESQQGTLRAAVEQASALGSSLFAPGRYKRRATQRAEAATTANVPSTENISTPQILRLDAELAEAGGTDHGDSLRSKLKRRRTSLLNGRTHKRNNIGATIASADGGPMDGFLEMLDTMLQRFDTVGNEEGNCHELFSNRELNTLFGELLKLRAESLIQSIPPATLLRTMKVLDQHIKQTDLFDEQDDPDTNSRIMLSLEAIQAAITIMAAPNMPKQVYNEEIIDNIVQITKYHIVHHIFFAFDPTYRLAHGEGVAEPDENSKEESVEGIENGAPSKRKSRPKPKPPAGRKSVSNKVAKPVMELHDKVCSIVASLSELLAAVKLQGAVVSQLTQTLMASFGVENIELLQLKCIVVICTVFKYYPSHRPVVISEVVALLWKLPTSKRSLRTYHVAEDRKQIQMISALLVQLVQCSVQLPEVEAVSNDKDADKEQAQDLGSSSFKPAVKIAGDFWTTVLDRWALPKGPEGVDIKGLLENLVIDLIECLDVPELPASNLLLQILCIFLLSSKGLQSKEQIVRGHAVELLGLIAGRLKKILLTCSTKKPWMISKLDFDVVSADMSGKDVTAVAGKKKACTSCGEKLGNSFCVSCLTCQRSFHGICVSVGETDLVDNRGWLCHCCFCQQHLIKIYQDVQSKPEQNGRKEKKDTATVEEAGKSLSDFQSKVNTNLLLQQFLLNYLQVNQEQGDPVSTCARSFYLCWWNSEEKPPQGSLELYRGRLESVTPTNSAANTTPMKRDAIIRVALELAQNSSLLRGFDKILDGILMTLHDNASMPRVKALKAVGILVEASSAMLEDERVKPAVEERLMDSAISVREAAVDLVGKYMLLSPNVALKYYDKIAERTRDTGVSVRKKVIKIVKDVLVSVENFSKKADACAKIMERITDDENSIRELVIKTFHELWFQEHHNGRSQPDANGTPIDIVEQTEQIVEVLRGPSIQLQLVAILKRILEQDANPQIAKGGNMNLIPQGAIRRRCETMCKCMLEGVLQAYEASPGECETKALPYVSGLQSFCMVDPTLCAPTSDTSRFAVTLQPYLKTQADQKAAGASFVQCVVYIVDSVLPLLRRPSVTFLDGLDHDLRQMIVSHRYLYVVRASVKCLCSLSKIHTKSNQSVTSLIRYHCKRLNEKPAQLDEKSQTGAVRYLFVLGLLARYASELIDKGSSGDINLESIINIYLSYLKFDDFSVKIKALQGLGFIFVSKPELFLREDMRALLHAALMQSSDNRLKKQTLMNILDYLHDVEGKLALGSSNEDAAPLLKIAGKEVPVAAGAGDKNNNCGGIVQLFWDKILERALDVDVEVRQTALKVIEVVLRQGLVHPVTSVPTLIALEVDQNEANAKLAHRLVMMMNERHGQFIENKLGDGLQASFQFVQSGAAVLSSTGGESPAIVPKRAPSAAPPSLLDTSKDGIARVYKLIRSNRTSRNKFMGSIIRKFDSTNQIGESIDLLFLQYCTEILASLPFEIPDEPLYLIYSVNRIVQIRCGPLQSIIKASISGDGPLAKMATEERELMSVDGNKQGKESKVNEDKRTAKGMAISGAIDASYETAFQRVKGDCKQATALTLLLLLKKHLKYTYNLPDTRCQAFQPSEAIQKGEALTKRDIGAICCKNILLDTPSNIREVLVQYHEFKTLLEEDSTSDFVGFATAASKRRVSMSVMNDFSDKGDNSHFANGNGNGTVVTKSRSKRRNSEPSFHNLDTEDRDGDEDDDYTENDGKKENRRRQSSATRRPTTETSHRRGK